MFRKFVLAFSLVGLLGLGGISSVEAKPGDASITCFDCWEMKVR